MKYILLGFIRVYQMIPGSWHGMCKHIPSCSNYGIEAIREYGSIKGSYLTILRIIRCNPFSKGGYDPVPRRKYEKDN